MLDLVAQHQSIRDEVLQAVNSVVDRQAFIMGAEVAALEEAVARVSATRFAVGCASGTDALLLPLRALGLKPGDEVITTPFTFFATAGAVHNAGGRPVFVDIEADSFNIDPAALEAAITPRTHHPGASLRPDGRHGTHPADRPETQPGGHRGRGAVDRGPPPDRRALGAERRTRNLRHPFLLPEQESGRLG
jgi:hypothetical protein